MKINAQWEALKEESHANIQSEKGILNRQIRSIQTEGHFGDIKENDSFRRFNYRTAEKVDVYKRQAAASQRAIVATIASLSLA